MKHCEHVSDLGPCVKVSWGGSEKEKEKNLFHAFQKQKKSHMEKKICLKRERSFDLISIRLRVTYLQVFSQSGKQQILSCPVTLAEFGV